MKVSVVIPTHDRVETLKLAIDSVLNQTYRANEVIVVDDTGSQNTKELVESYNDLRIQFITNPNSGASSSRNLGASIANSEFVAFLDDDDVWLSNKLEKQLSLAKKENLDAVFSQLIVNYESIGVEYPTKSRNLSEPLKSICMENYIGATISCVVKKSIFLKVNGFDTSFQAREEYDLWIRIISSRFKIGIVEEPLAISNRSFVRNRISSNLSRYEQGIELLNRKHQKLISDCLNEQEQKLRRSKQFDFLAAQAISIGRRVEAVRYYYDSFLICPRLKTAILAFLGLVSPILLIRIRSRM
ncbi:glycosyltransferase family 2 protein [Vibrio owensii]|uniref:Glycosyltransferase 2-like domain-containing protein n=1 Tax=Vibrio owensii CAIM 1854 = LMG 25443 TaxID=1229493 RepID=A0A0C1YZP8_9VIBR|nr:glycosyltransferase family A protein [Vibrio owensii]KIF50395.1 hypothetical protein H735_24935 [Vibrio owensii CAIM 1854 = LMG 25443]